jgi:hypothetical protein
MPAQFPAYQNMISHATVAEIQERHERNKAMFGATEKDIVLKNVVEADEFDKKKGFNCHFQLEWFTYIGWKTYMWHTGCIASDPKFEDTGKANAE